jgi:hypothetical protein
MVEREERVGRGGNLKNPQKMEENLRCGWCG